MQTGEQLVSVVLPTYNRKAQLGDTIKSVLEQTHKNWELIIVDDGSTDGTDEYINEWLEKDARIQYHLLPKNVGASAARNVAISLAKGAFITFIDSDDCYLPTKIERQLEVFGKNSINKVGVVSCGRNDFRNGKLYNKWKPSYRGNVIDLLFSDVRIGAQTSFLMVTREVIDEGIKFDTNINVVEDFDFVAQALTKGYGFDFVDDYLVDVYHYEIDRNFDYERGYTARIYLYNKYRHYLDKNITVRNNYLYKTCLFDSMSKKIYGASVAMDEFKRSFPLVFNLFRLAKPLPSGVIKNAIFKVISKLFFMRGKNKVQPSFAY